MNSELHAQPLHSRRRLVLAIPLLGCMAKGGAWAATPNPSTATRQRVQESRVLMGTRVDITAAVSESGIQSAQAAVRQAFEHMVRLEALMSRYQKNSDINRIGKAAGLHSVQISPAVMAVLQRAQRLYRDSEGAFDITVGALRGWNFEPGHEAAPTPAQIERTLPLVNMEGLVLNARAGTAYLTRSGMALDLGGVTKFPILEAGMQCLAKAGVHNALINGGGDVLTAGLLHGHPWRIGVRNPSNPVQMMGILELQGNCVVASSGDYERGFSFGRRRLHHVLDPRTGWPTDGVHGATLLARTIDEVNGWGTALMVRGLAQIDAWHAQHPSVEALLVSANGQRWMSQGMTQALRPIPS